MELSKKRRNVRTICLPVESSQQVDNLSSEDQILTIAGWGLTESGTSEMSDVLLKAHIPYMPQDKCIAVFEEKMINVKIIDNQICAGGYNKTDSCNGDSGTALGAFAKLGNLERFFQHGIVSFGSKDCSRNTAIPGVYTRVEKYIEWILDNMTVS